MRTSLFAFVSDLLEEGTDAVVRNVRDRAAVGGLTVAAAYHAARDVVPHSPRGLVRFLEPGVVYFHPDPARWTGRRLQPRPSALVAHADPIAELCALGAAEGFDVDAWVVFLHNDRLGFEQPGCAPRNAFGDRYLTDLCPAHTDVRAYVRALAGDVARLGVGSVVAESLHHHPFEHGYHHERAFVELSDHGRRLLGLCFCDSCLAAAEARDVDGRAARTVARRGIERALVGAEEVGFDRTLLRDYLEARSHTVTSLAAEAAEAVTAEGSTLRFMDLSGAVAGYATGRPSGPPVVEDAFDLLGVAVPRVAEPCAAIDALGYAAEPQRVALDLDAYRALLHPGAPLGLVLRPTPPDCVSVVNLRAKVAVARAHGVDRLAFYHYGLMPLEALDWIAAALDGSPAA